ESDALARSAVLPTSTAESVTGAFAGTWPFAAGAMVRTMGGAATADGDGAAAGLGCAPGGSPGDGWAAAGDGVGSARCRSASLAWRVGGRPGAVGAALPGTAPRTGRSLAGAHATDANVTTRAKIRSRISRPESTHCGAKP